MSLHDRIMNIPEENDDGLLIGEDKYWIGFVNGKRQAAQIAKEADELMDRMVEALLGCAEDDADGLDAAMARDTLDMYNNWKDQTND